MIATATDTNIHQLRPNMSDAKLRLSAGDPLELDVLRFQGEEELGRLFRFDIHVAIPDELADTLRIGRAVIRGKPEQRTGRTLESSASVDR